MKSLTNGQDEELRDEHPVQLVLGVVVEGCHEGDQLGLKLRGHHQNLNLPNGQEESSDWLE